VICDDRKIIAPLYKQESCQQGKTAPIIVGTCMRPWFNGLWAAKRCIIVPID